jgi:hypothetical protein
LGLFAQDKNIVIKPCQFDAVSKGDIMMTMIDSTIIVTSLQNKFYRPRILKVKSDTIFCASQWILFDTTFKYNVSSVTINPNNNEVYFSASANRDKRFINNTLFKGILLRNRITNIHELSFCLNTNSYLHVSVATDGNTLFYSESSDRKYSIKSVSKSNNATGWSEPTTLMTGQESTVLGYPSSINDSTLAYSSNEPGGVGNFDIYKLKLRNGKWGGKENWTQLNTIADEIGFYAIDEDKGYFFSNRNTGVDRLFFYKYE